MNALVGAWRSQASAPALGAGGPEFESRRPDQIVLVFRDFWQAWVPLRSADAYAEYRTAIWPVSSLLMGTTASAAAIADHPVDSQED